MKKTLATGLIIISSIVMPTFFVFAQAGGTTPMASTQLENPLKSGLDTFPKFAAKVIDTAAQILLPFIVLGFIYSGFLFVKAQGNEAGLTEAKTAITYSIIGAFILMGAWGFAQIISTTVSTLTR